MDFGLYDQYLQEWEAAIKKGPGFPLHIIYFEDLKDVSKVKPVLSGHSKIDKTNISMTNGSLMKVESIAECSPWSILQYF